MKISEIISDNCDLLGDVREAEEKQQHCEDEYIKVPKKALKYRTAGMVAYNAEWLKKHFDIERAVICGVQEHYEDAISRQAVIDATVKKNGIWNSITNSKGENLEEIISQLPSVNQQEPCSNCCNGNQIEKAKLCQKSYLAGMEHKQEQCADAISRRAALDSIHANCVYENEYNLTAKHIEDAVKQLPPVNPQKPICPSAGVDCEDCPAYEPKVLNKWIGAEVLDRIRNEMHATAEKHEDGVYYLRDEWVDEIIDKYAEGSEKK